MGREGGKEGRSKERGRENYHFTSLGAIKYLNTWSRAAAWCVRLCVTPMLVMPSESTQLSDGLDMV